MMRVVFVVACVVAGFAAVANWWSRWRDSAAVETWSKPLTTVAVIAMAATAGAPAAPTVAAVVALVLCLIGDVSLMRDRFIPGLAAFLLGHIAFAVMFVIVGLRSTALAGLAVLIAALLGAGVAPHVLRGARAQGLRRPVAAYLVVISAMTVIGWATANPWFSVGATAFIVSDSILGWSMFVHRHRWMPVAIMVTYHVAIAALAVGLTAV